jgi:hypothetical protein
VLREQPRRGDPFDFKKQSLILRFQETDRYAKQKQVPQASTYGVLWDCR